MIKHIALWKVKKEVEDDKKDEVLQEIKLELEALKDQIDVIVRLDVGIDILGTEASYDIIVDSEFKNLEDLSIYQKDPRHLKVVGTINKYLESRVAIDYTIE